MSVNSSSDTPSSQARVVAGLRRFAEPMWLSFKLTNNSLAASESYRGQSTAEAWTLAPGVLHLESATNIEWHELNCLDGEVESIVALATEEFIEDGMDSDTEAQLGEFVSRYSAVGVRRLVAYLASDCVKSRTVSDIIRVLGRLEHEESHNDRFWIVARFLSLGTPLARDASAVALEDLGDPRAIPKLEEAVGVESVPELRDGLQIALEELRKSVDAQVSQEAR